MDFNKRNESISELSAQNKKLGLTVLVLGGCLLLALVKMVMQSEILIVQTPGMPDNAYLERSYMDKASQEATLLTVTSSVVEINPDNAEYQKKLLGMYLSPASYTKIERDIDVRVAQLIAQRELGSYYFVLKKYEYDPLINKHFVIGDLHTVNAAKDSAQQYVFEYSAHIQNYRLWVDEVVTYEGDRAHNADYLKGQSSDRK
jgi:conjugal transfer pilus assembly protein TraE